MSPEAIRALQAFVAGADPTDSVFCELMEALPVAVYMTDPEGRLTYFNRAAVKLSGRTPELGTDKWCVTWKLFLPDGTPLPHDQCPMAVALQGGDVPAGIECVAERPDGTRFWFTPYPAALRDAEGRVIGGMNLLLDITDRKNAEMEAYEQFRTIVETTPECVKIVAPDGTLLFMNRPGLAMVGAPGADAVTGKNVYDVIAPEDREKFREFNEAICKGERGSLEFDMVGLQGARSRMETHAAPLRHVDGRTVHLAITRNITERKRAERASLLLGAIVDSSDDAIISKDLNGVIMSWNKSAERLFGYTAEEAIGQTIADLLIPADRQDEEPDILARLRRGERVDHFETVRRRKDGTLLDISVTISPVKDAQGEIIGASKIARDISERKRAEQAIQTLNAQLTSDLAAMTRIQQLSTRLLQQGDFPRLLEEIVEASIAIAGANAGNIQLLEGTALKICAQRGVDAKLPDVLNNLQGSEAASETAVERRDRIIVEDVTTSSIFTGTPALAAMMEAGLRAVQSTPLLSRSGQMLGVLSTYCRTPCQPSERDLRLLDILARLTADLIERKRAEAALLASESRFRQLADAMPQLVWTARPDGAIDYYNERWYEFTGFSRDAFDASWDSILHPDDVQRTRETYYAAIHSGQPYDIEYRFWDRREKRWKWFVGRALPVRDAQGKIVKWFGSCTDIDEQKRVQEELLRANQDLEQFAFSASHDLQEPLRSVKIYSELLMKRHADRLDGEALKFMQYLRNGASRMEALVRDLLTYTRVTKFDASAEVSDANEALKAVLDNLAGAIQESGAQISADPLPSVSVHGMHLQQVFQNLIGNAIKYRSRERLARVHVTAERQGGYWLFAVSDNGIGIDPEYRENVFGLFKRLHTSHEYSGTGIGLAICQRIVDRYHGRIWVESEPGQGSTFRFILPV